MSEFPSLQHTPTDSRYWNNLGAITVTGTLTWTQGSEDGSCWEDVPTVDLPQAGDGSHA
jgi:hypothetical protein